MKNTKLRILGGIYQLTRLPKNSSIPQEIFEQDFYTISRTSNELSIIAPEEIHIDSEYSEKSWRIIQFVESMDLSLVGITARITNILARENINLCAIATYNTDYILIKNHQIEIAIKALENAGYLFVGTVIGRSQYGTASN